MHLLLTQRRQPAALPRMRGRRVPVPQGLAQHGVARPGCRCLGMRARRAALAAPGSQSAQQQRRATLGGACLDCAASTRSPAGSKAPPSMQYGAQAVSLQHGHEVSESVTKQHWTSNMQRRHLYACADISVT